jgi:hypothetical protein
MTKIAEIALEQYSAVASWSPIPSHPDIVALGSKVRALRPLGAGALVMTAKSLTRARWEGNQTSFFSHTTRRFAAALRFLFSFF